MRKVIMMGIMCAAFMMMPVTAMAAPAKTAEGLTFDAEYYLANNPDVVSVFGNDATAAYKHYLQYGIKEGRPAFAGDTGQTYTAPVKTETTKKTSSSTPSRESVASGTLLASYDIVLYPSSASNTNARLACDLIDGATVAPGKEFSFNGTTGERTSEKGFVKADVIVNKQHVKALGGGVCKVSTGLYNAVLGAGLDVTERYSHSLACAYAKKDATVSYGSKDFKFVNNTDKTIMVGTAYDANGFHFYLYQV